MLKVARLLCSEGHEWLSFIYNDERASDRWAEYQLGILLAAFEPAPPFVEGCPACASPELHGEIREYRPIA